MSNPSEGEYVNFSAATDDGASLFETVPDAAPAVQQSVAQPASQSQSKMVMKMKPKKMLLLVLVVLLVLLLLVVLYRRMNKSEHLVSFRDFPGQKQATAEMLARATSGLNMNSDPSLQDPYSKAMLDLSSLENAWVTSNWKFTG